MSMAGNSSGIDNRVDSASLDETAAHAPEGINNSERSTSNKPDEGLRDYQHVEKLIRDEDFTPPTYLGDTTLHVA